MTKRFPSSRQEADDGQDRKLGWQFYTEMGSPRCSLPFIARLAKRMEDQRSRITRSRRGSSAQRLPVGSLRRPPGNFHIYDYLAARKTATAGRPATIFKGIGGGCSGVQSQALLKLPKGVMKIYRLPAAAIGSASPSRRPQDAD